MFRSFIPSKLPESSPSWRSRYVCVRVSVSPALRPKALETPLRGSMNVTVTSFVSGGVTLPGSSMAGHWPIFHGSLVLSNTVKVCFCSLKSWPSSSLSVTGNFRCTPACNDGMTDSFNVASAAWSAPSAVVLNVASA